jgi:DinB superfamily
MSAPTTAFKYPDFFKGYISLVQGNDPVGLLEKSLGELEQDLHGLNEIDFNATYATGKWTIGQLLRHCIDAELIFAFRALTIARMDPNPIRSFDENAYAAESVSDFIKNDLLESFILARKSTIMLFKSFDAAWLNRNGLTQSHETISVGALGIIAIGHWRHHKLVLEQRYGLRF